MNQDFLIRTRMLFGNDAVDALAHKRVALFGVGGVGGYVAEALARCGVGAVDLIDNDTVNLSNINRQIIALHSTLGQPKVEVARARMLDINPAMTIRTFNTFYLPETADQFDFTQYDYVVDAIDTVTAKIDIILRAQAADTPVISSMGTGNKTDPTQFEITDIYKTSICPLAKVMRRELKKRGVKKLKVLYSKELARTPLFQEDEALTPAESVPAVNAPLENDAELAGNSADKAPAAKAPTRRATPASCAFVPSVAGLIIAGEVIRDLMAS
ncbi:MAG: tRNA threonylcarbamoyladenosine dehydratase [Lachnospiraceae bacterium]|nr:tRNA threonylcarbamoyladenosine dehydratase [Lachnospiraceae bacterium]